MFNFVLFCSQESCTCEHCQNGSAICSDPVQNITLRVDTRCPTDAKPCTINNQEPGQEYQSTKELFGENNDGKETSLVTSTVTTLQ